MATWTVAARLMGFNETLSSLSANVQVAWISTFPINASKVQGTVRVFIALIRLQTTINIGIADSSLRTNTLIRSGCVLAASTRVTRTIRALVDISASKWRSDKSNITATLAFHAHLCLRTVHVGVAAWLTGALIIADLSRETVVVCIADLSAHALMAALSDGTIIGASAHEVALIVLTGVALHALA